MFPEVMEVHPHLQSPPSFISRKAVRLLALPSTLNTKPLKYPKNVDDATNSKSKTRVDTKIMSQLKIAVILSSVRPKRLNERVAKLVTKQIQLKGHTVITIDPLHYKLPLLDTPIHWQNRNDAPELLRTISDKLIEADAFIVVSAEYNHTIPPALSNLMSFFFPEYKYKPSGIVSYSPGAMGGVRAAMALRPFLAELGCVSIPKLLAIGLAQQKIDENGVASDSKTVEFTDAFLDQLFWYAEAMKVQRQKGVPA